MTYSWAPPKHRWADLLNSDFHDHLGSGREEDRLGIDDWLGPFLDSCGWSGARLPSAAGRGRLRRLRTLLADVVTSIVEEGEPSAADLRALNRWLRLDAREARLIAQDGRFDLREAPTKRGLARVLGRIARSLADVLAAGELDRIKICANPDCRWVVYDESRAKTRRWCEATECGNLIKVRRFRERRRARAGAGRSAVRPA